MDINDFFPEDPLEPTIKYIGNNQTPFAVPWARGRVQMYAGFDSQCAHDHDLFVNCAAFRDTSGVPLQYRECQITSIRDESGSSIANSSENTNFAIGASVGGSFLGASGRGNYEKSVRDSRNVSNMSVRAHHVCGLIDVIRAPPLAEDAVRLLCTSPDPVNEFRQRYGDFYVAGCRIGAVTNTTISGNLVNKTFFEAKVAAVDVKILFVKVTKSIDERSQSASREGELRVAAFDSLTAFDSNLSAITPEDSILVGKIASANKERAMTIGTRAGDVLQKEFSLGRERTVYQDVVNRLADRGLITEVLLAPFAGLREYQSLLLRRVNLRL